MFLNLNNIIKESLKRLSFFLYILFIVIIIRIMKMKSNNNPLQELTRMLNENSSKKVNKKKNLLEGYLSENDFEPSMQQQPIPQGGEEEDFPLQGIEGGDGDAMAQEQGILPIKNEIDQIRQIALKTIARLAENPVSESYQMMKKIWMMCDKAIESALQPEESNSKKGNSGSF